MRPLLCSILRATVMETNAAPAGSTLGRVSDRLGECSHAIAARAFGVAVGVRANDPDLLSKLIARLPPGSETIDSELLDVRYSVFRQSASDAHSDDAVYIGVSGDQPFFKIGDESAALDLFESTVRFDVAVSAADWLFVHAGVVRWRDQAIVVPAPSMHGKSRMVDALVRAGAGYYSDEFAVIDAGGLVHPFRIPLSLRNESGGAQRVVVDLEDEAKPLPIGLVVTTRYEDGATWNPRRGTPGEAAMALLANTVRARIAPAHTLTVLARAAVHAVLLDGPRGDADDTALRLLAESRQR